jgi:pSer/pThr/pTyr-binding forkhead associated (FHA) protein
MSSQNASISLPLNTSEAFALACKATAPIRCRARHKTTGVEQEFKVPSPYAFVGRSPMAAIRLDDPSISQCHAYLQVIEGMVYCIDLGSRSGIIWEDGTRGRGWLGAGQTVQFGTFEVVLDEFPSKDNSSSFARDDCEPEVLLSTAVVDVFSSNLSEAKCYPLDRPITIIGRHPSSELRLFDESIGYFQCALVNTSVGIWFVDALSRNGGLLNGRRCRIARIKDGDLFEFGKLSLVFKIGAHATGNRVAVSESVPVVPGPVLTGQIAEAMSYVMLPVGEMVKQFQQCFVSMAQMFNTMQQEHALLVTEQMRQIQELAEELRSLRAEVRNEVASATPAVAPDPPSAAPSSPPSAPSPSPASSSPLPGEAAGAQKPLPRYPNFNHNSTPGETFADAHAWFMKRLANKGQSSEGS